MLDAEQPVQSVAILTTEDASSIPDRMKRVSLTLRAKKNYITWNWVWKLWIY